METARDTRSKYFSMSSTGLAPSFGTVVVKVTPIDLKTMPVVRRRAKLQLADLRVGYHHRLRDRARIIIEHSVLSQRGTDVNRLLTVGA